LKLPGSITNPQLTGARFLLTPGRKYEDSVKRFQPYDRLQEPNEDAGKQEPNSLLEGSVTNRDEKRCLH
jgi:hypothetical protein